MKLILILLTLAISSCHKKKLVCIIEDYRCGHKFAVYHKGDKVIIDSIPEDRNGLFIPLMIYSAPPKDTAPYIQYWDWDSTRLNVPEYIDKGYTFDSLSNAIAHCDSSLTVVDGNSTWIKHHRVTDKGMFAIKNPAEGQTVFNVDRGVKCYYDGEKWNELTGYSKPLNK